MQKQTVNGVARVTGTETGTGQGPGDRPIKDRYMLGEMRTDKPWRDRQAGVCRQEKIDDLAEQGGVCGMKNRGSYRH